MSQQQTQPEPSDIQSSMNLLMVVLHIYSHSVDVGWHTTRVTIFGEWKEVLMWTAFRRSNEVA